MNMKKLFIIPMVAPVLLGTANASLPDEINYSPYEQQYNDLSTTVDQITTSLTQAQADLENAYNREANIHDNIERIDQENYNLNNSINRLTTERNDLITETNNLERRINRLTKRVRNLERERDNIEADIQSENRRLEPLQRRIKDLKRDLRQKNKEVDVAKTAVRNAKNARATVKKDVDRFQKTLTSQQATLKRNQDLLKSIDSKITNSKASLETKKNALTNAKAEQTAAVAVQTGLKAEQAKKQKELRDLIASLGDPRQARNNPKVIAKRKEIAAINVKLRQQAGVIKTAKAKVAKIQKEVNALNTQIVRLTNQKKTLPATINKNKEAVKKTRASLKTKKEQLKLAIVKVETKQKALDAKALEANKVSNNLTRVQDKLTRESVRRNNLLIALDKKNGRINVVGEELRVASNNYNRSMDRISYIDNEIPELRRSIRTNNTELRRLENSLDATEQLIVDLGLEITDLTTEQRTAVDARDNKYQEYITRYQLYNQKLAKAKKLGASQTDVATSIGNTDSTVYADTRSVELGTKIGKGLAQSQANLWSAVRAEVKGYNIGYNEGYASEVDQARGEQEGTAAGIQAAQDYAQTTLKPQFFNQIFSATLEGQTLRSNELVEVPLAPEEMAIFQPENKEAFDSVAGVGPISQNEINQSNNTTTDLDRPIVEFNNNLLEVLRQKNALASATNAYVKPATIPYQQFDCSTVYKNLVVFKRACKDSYLSTFDKKYLKEHKANFEDIYTGKYNDVVETNRAADLPELYENGYDQFYPIAKANGVSNGKKDIFKVAFNRAKTNAYDQEIPRATTVAKADARDEVADWVTNNATLTLTGSKIAGSNMRGGAANSVTLRIKNISPKSMRSPVRIVITKAQNAVFTQKDFYTQNIAGNSTTSFSGIQFKVNPNSTSNQRVLIEGKAYLPGGKYQSARVETFAVSGVTDVNPAVSESKNYDDTPKIVTSFRRRTLIHNFDVSLAPKIEALPQGYNVSLSAMPGSESYIQFKNTSVNTGRINVGAQKKVQFKYTFVLAAKNKVVKVKMNITYKGQIVKSQIIELRPH